MERSSGNIQRSAMIRANPTQTAILKKALSESSSPTSVQLKTLSEQTNLPEKWIHNWFGRQRLKANNTRAKAATPAERLSLLVKQEATDAAISSPAAGSVSDYTTLSTSSSATTKTNARKRKASAKAAERAESPVRVLRSGKRMAGASAPALPARRVKAEKIDAVRSEDDAALPQALARGIGFAGSSSKPGPMLPSVAPPTRSSKPPAAATAAPAKMRAGQPAGQPKNMHARIPPGAGLLRAGPVFHSQFQNNGPADFSSTSNMPRSSMYAPERSHGGAVRGRLVPVPYTLQAPGLHASVMPSLAPAFDWETHAPAHPVGVYVTDNPVHAHCNWDVYAQPSAALTPANVSALLPVDSAVLDPSQAPLKHLTEVLHAFRDECGTYARVLAPDAHGSLLKCLLDENMMPFQAAMGLAFLSRLGFQWNW
ncbi:hypothetical protein HYPSUDRAFT_76669 [Hypholoma sublateritium FD-334 SS-4]|uniref:Homeobox domain-containing protein n=1 Tax=Hypholoma sublateritium (strain FD-334 SS-4) TaxID=945553 RepID=A0A0D2LA37_HYPSF|nr:hypothetical protein HYPSUDRAFT_76669 [Hypholoma sublateritium FD-334 SS-4]